MKPEPFKRRAFIRNNVVANIARLREALSQPIPPQPAQASQGSSSLRAPDFQAGNTDPARQLS